MTVKPSLFKKLKEVSKDYEFDPRARHAIEMADVARKAGFRVNEDNAQRYAKKFMEEYIPDRSRLDGKAREVAEYNMKHDWLKNLYDKSEDGKKRKILDSKEFQNAKLDFIVEQGNDKNSKYGQLRKEYNDCLNDIDCPHDKLERLYDDVLNESRKQASYFYPKYGLDPNNLPLSFSDWLKEQERGTFKNLSGYEHRMPFDPKLYLDEVPSYKHEENRWRSDNPIKRYHTTKSENVKSILKGGLKPRRKGGFQDVLGEDSPRRMRAVFTESRGPKSDENGFALYYGMNDKQLDQYLPETGEVKLELEIPKDVYTNMRRFERNEEVPWGRHGDRLLGVMSGGRTDMFKDKIPPEYIKAIWTEADGGFKRHTIEDWIENH